MKPTDEQIKELYIKVLDGKVEFGTVVDNEIACYRRTTWNKEDEEWNIEVIPRTDSLEYLGWLFKYAVPKLDQSRYYKALSSIFLKENANATTLFWAIYEVIKV